MTYETVAKVVQQGGTIYFVVMFAAAAAYAFWPSKKKEFEKAARVRDQLAILKQQAFGAPGSDNLAAIARAWRTGSTSSTATALVPTRSITRRGPRPIPPLRPAPWPRCRPRVTRTST